MAFDPFKPKVDESGAEAPGTGNAMNIARVGTGNTNAATFDKQGPKAATAPTTPSTGRFVNFDRYFNANADAANAGAKQLVSNAAAGAGRATKAVDDLQSKAQAAIKAGTPVYGNEVGQGLGSDERLDRPTGYVDEPGAGWLKTSTSSGLKPGPGEGPKFITSNDASLKAQQQYTGPAELSEVDGYKDAAGKVTKAASYAKAISTAGGREALAQRGGAPTAGGSALDSALWGYAGGNSLDKASKRFGGLEQYLTTASSNVANDVAGGRAMAESVKRSYENLAARLQLEEQARREWEAARAEAERRGNDEHIDATGTGTRW